MKADVKSWIEDGRLQVHVDLKGDLPGHPFRGNQWSGSQGGSIDDWPIDKRLEVGRAAKTYAHRSVDGRKVSAVSKDYIAGKDGKELEDNAVAYGAWEDHVKSAKILVDEIRRMPENDTTLYRAVSFPPDKDPLSSIESGQVVSLDRITSFSEGRDWAANYAGRNEDGETSYEMVIEGPSKSLPTDWGTGLKHKERITEGKFEVVRVEDGEAISRALDEGYGQANYRKRIVLRQVGVF